MIYILTYTVLLVAIVYFLEYRKKITSEDFLVSNRELSFSGAALSIAASWIWAPAVFISTKVGYEWGYAGLFWFCLPNFLALCLFSPFASKVRQTIPSGYTYIEFIKNKTAGFAYVQLAIQVFMQIIIFALQITAGSEMLSLVTGVDYSLLVVIMAITPILYTIKSGLLSGVLTDIIQYIIMIIGALLILYNFPIAENFNFQIILPTSIFESKMLLEFGIPSALGLTFAIFADHQQWQRVFAIKQKVIVPIYISAGFLHLLFTFSMGSLGVLIATTSFEPTNSQLIGIEYLKLFMPSSLTIVFIFVALSALCSTLDSALCAFSSLYVRHLSRDSNILRAARLSMIALVLSASIVALLRIPLITLWFIAGTIRLATFAPTAFSILFKDFPGLIGTIACLSGFTIGGLTFFTGLLLKNSHLQTLGMVLSWGVSLLIVSYWACRQKKKFKL